VPAGGPVTVQARAVAADGSTSAVDSRAVIVDTVPPTSAMERVLVDGTAVVVELTAQDPFPAGGPIARVEVQAEGGPWRAATWLGTVDGRRRWRLRWPLEASGPPQRFRARSVDFAGNASALTAWRLPDVEAPVGADLAVDQSAPAGAVRGGLLRYALEVTNNGPEAATGVRLVDSLPGPVTLIEHEPGCLQQDGALVCDLGRLEPQQAVTVRFTVRLDASAAFDSLLNVATVRSDVVDPDPSNNRSERTTPLGPSLVLPWLSKDR
jgi:uncharacterized repeat protein (TIGR01451 family)